MTAMERDETLRVADALVTAADLLDGLGGEHHALAFSMRARAYKLRQGALAQGVSDTALSIATEALERIRCLDQDQAHALGRLLDRRGYGTAEAPGDKTVAEVLDSDKRNRPWREYGS